MGPCGVQGRVLGVPLLCPPTHRDRVLAKGLQCWLKPQSQPTLIHLPLPNKVLRSFPTLVTTQYIPVLGGFSCAPL